MNCIICLVKLLCSYNLNHVFCSLLKAVKMTERKTAMIHFLVKCLLFMSRILATKRADFINIHLVSLHLSEFGMWISHGSAAENIPLYLVLCLHTYRTDSTTIILRPYYYWKVRPELADVLQTFKL